MFAQPLNELDHDRVSPHPGWKTPEIAKCLVRVVIITAAADVTMDAKAVRPIGFDRDRAKAVVCDQAPGELCARGVKIVGAMRSFPDQDALCLSRECYESVISFGERSSYLPNDRGVTLE